MGWGFPTWITVSIIGGTLSYLVHSYYSAKEKRIAQKLSTTVPKCPKCGKQISKANFDFCPFCGASLTQG